MPVEVSEGELVRRCCTAITQHNRENKPVLLCPLMQNISEGYKGGRRSRRSGVVKELKKEIEKGWMCVSGGEEGSEVKLVNRG